MAGKDYSIVVLSSSPPAPDAFDSPRYAAPTRRVAMPPSSPLALSPPSSPRKHPLGALTSGSRAASIPDKATRGFATVGSLVRLEHFAQPPDDFADVINTRPQVESLGDTVEEVTAAKKPRKRATKTAAVVDGEKPTAKPRGRKVKAGKEFESEVTVLDSELRLPRATKSPFFDNAPPQETGETPAGPAVEAPKLTKSGKPRKPRAKKEKPENGDTEPEPKPKKTRVAKPKTAGKTGGAQEIESAPFSVETDRVDSTTWETGPACDWQGQDSSIGHVSRNPESKRRASKERLPDPVAQGLDLDEAVLRRRDWTPVRDTVAQSPSTVSTGKENKPCAHDTTAGAFTHIVSNFTYESPTIPATSNSTRPTAAPSGITKRRRVELVELPGVQTNPKAASPEKGKAPKKKPRTITDLVTGQYAPKFTDVDAQTITSDFFCPRTSTTKVPLNDIAAPEVDVQQKKPSRKRSKSRDDSEGAAAKAKSRVRKTTAKSAAKAKPAAEKLLSPTSAVMRMNRQEVLFGTSSQLALEDSPTTVRQIQRAITESEQQTTHLPTDDRLRWPKLQRVEGKRSLWRESTRDSDGGLLENMENVYIPEPDRTQDLPLLMDTVQEEPTLRDGFVDIDDIVSPEPITISSDLPTPPQSQSQDYRLEPSPTQAAFGDVFYDADSFDSGLPPSNQSAKLQTSFADIDDFQSAPPAAALRSTARPPASAPAVDVAKGSPKPRRGRPPRSKSAIPSVPASAPSALREPSPTYKAPQRLLSTPQKGSGRFIDIEEILDSEDEALEAFSPTPPRVRRLQDSPPLQLALDKDRQSDAHDQADKHGSTPVLRVSTSLLEWSNIRPSICTAITTHVRSIPPTTNPKKPSWHEKILMYDPIVLEDFTAYLNGNTSLRTYKRATQKQIKAYNNILKSRGDAILGVERDDQVLVIEKELEVFMVRDWCQELSICCIHAKESRGRGSARKGLY